MANGPSKNSFSGTKYKIAYDPQTELPVGEKTILERNVSEMTFNNSISYDANFGFEHTDKFKNQEVKLSIWQSASKNNSLYSNHTFANSYDWDDFYYDRNNIRLLETN